jgi:hypothetical protein
MPDHIYLSDHYLYVTQVTTIYIYSLKNYKLVKKFGKQGEGPQEFKKKIDNIVIGNDEIMVSSMGRVSYFTFDGRFKRERNDIYNIGWAFSPIRDKFVGRGFKKEGKQDYYTLSIFDSNLKRIKTFCQKKTEGFRVFSGPKYFLVHDDKVFVGFEKDFLIDAFNGAGESIFSIKRQNYEKIKVEDVHKKEVYNFFRANPWTKGRYKWYLANIEFPAFFSAIRDFYTSDKRIYIRTYKKVNNKTEFFIYDTNGKFIKIIFVPFIERGGFEFGYTLHTIKNHKLYQLVENDDTDEWDLHAVDIK